MVKSILLCDLFMFCHNLKTWLIPEQYHILNDTVAFSKFSVSGHDQKKVAERRVGSGRERDREPGTG